MQRQLVLRARDRPPQTLLGIGYKTQKSTRWLPNASPAAQRLRSRSCVPAEHRFDWACARCCRSRHRPCAFPLLACQLSMYRSRVRPDRLPILRRRFHHYFFDLLFEQPIGQLIAQLSGIAPKLAPFKGVLAVDFDVGDDHGQHSSCEHQFQLSCKAYVAPSAGSGERAFSSLSRVTGYRRSHRSRSGTPNYSPNTHAPDQTLLRPRHFQCSDDLAAPSRLYLSSEPFS